METTQISPQMISLANDILVDASYWMEKIYDNPVDFIFAPEEDRERHVVAF